MKRLRRTGTVGPEYAKTVPKPVCRATSTFRRPFPGVPLDPQAPYEAISSHGDHRAGLPHFSTRISVFSPAGATQDRILQEVAMALFGKTSLSSLAASLRLPSVPREKLIQRLRVWARMLHLEQTVIPLCYVWMGAFLAAAGSMPPLGALLGLTIAVAGLRAFAVTLRRLADLELDRLHPRGGESPLVSGALSVPAARLLAFLAVLVYVLGCLMLNRLALALAPVPVLCVIAAAWARRYGWFSHFLAGLCLALAPAAGWLGVEPRLSLAAALFSCAVLFWTAGADIFAACRDVDFDAACGLHSAPARFGAPVALSLAAFSHAVFALFLFMAFWAAGLGWTGFGAWVTVAAVAAGGYRLLRPGEPERLHAVFSRLSMAIAVLMLLGVLLALFM